MRRPSTLLLAASLLAAATLAGCESAGDDRVLGIDATGTLVGLAFLDRDGNGKADAGDGPVEGLRIGLLRPGSGDTVANATTDAGGIYVMPLVAVGEYRVVVDSATVADTLEVAGIDSADVTLAADDTLAVLVRLGYPAISVADARTLATAKRVAVAGVALNGWAAFGDSTLHIADSTGAIRTLRVAPATIAAGDSVRLVGTAGTRDGQPVLTDVVSFLIGATETPVPDSVSTAAAARANDGANDGAIDAALVRVAGATVLGAQPTVSGDAVLTVDDGSGALEVLLDRHAGFATAPQPGMLLDAAGVLVPNAANSARWQLKPRSAADLSFDYPAVDIAGARGLPDGKRIAVTGIALNRWAAFGDSSIHVADATGAIRAIRSAFADFSPGDSVRVVGTTLTTADGERVLTTAVPAVLALGSPPDPRDASTADAATAVGGIEAALVRIDGAAIGDTATTAAGDFALTVDDGSGTLEVLLDRNAIGAGQRAPYRPGVTIDAVGLLVPAPGGAAWILKPRSAADLTVR